MIPRARRVRRPLHVRLSDSPSGLDLFPAPSDPSDPTPTPPPDPDFRPQTPPLSTPKSPLPSIRRHFALRPATLKLLDEEVAFRKARNGLRPSITGGRPSVVDTVLFDVLREVRRTRAEADVMRARKVDDHVPRLVRAANRLPRNRFTDYPVTRTVFRGEFPKEGEDVLRSKMRQANEREFLHVGAPEGGKVQLLLPGSYTNPEMVRLLYTPTRFWEAT